jgi:hypothetical protein
MTNIEADTYLASIVVVYELNDSVHSKSFNNSIVDI